MSTRDQVLVIPLNAAERVAVRAQGTLCRTCHYFDCDCGDEVQVRVEVEKFLIVRECSGYLLEVVVAALKESVS